MIDKDRVLPREVRYSEKPCQILIDFDSRQLPDYFDLFKRYPCATGIRDISICQSSAPTDAEHLIEHVRRGQLSWAGIGWLPFCPSFVNAARLSGKSPVEYADWLYDQCQKLNGAVGFRAAWIEAYGEIGNSISWPRNSKFTKREALNYFRDWMKDGRSLSEHWWRIVEKDVITYYAHAKRHDQNLRNLPIYYTDGTLFAIQEAYRLGFPMVCYEGGCGTMNAVQTGIAFARGGAKTFDALWGADLSPWVYGFPGETTRTSLAGTRADGMTPDQMFRIWITAYLAGCNMLLHEVGYGLFYTYPPDDTSLSEYGAKAMHFYHLTQTVLRDRGWCVAPFAIMLEEEHGYRGDMVREHTDDGELSFRNSTPFAGDAQLLIWQDKLHEITRGDWQVHRTLETLFPRAANLWSRLLGAWPDELSNLTDEQTPRLRSELAVEHIDSRDVARFVSDSAWADCFDVVPEDAPVDVLQKHYKVVLLTGDIQTDDGLWERLLRFAGSGGTIVASLEQLGAAARDFLHVRTTGPTENGFHRVDVSSDALVTDATLGDHVLQFKHGEGSIYLLLMCNGMDSAATQLHPSYLKLIDRLYQNHVGVRRLGPPCQMIVNHRQHNSMVTLLNHAGSDWEGELEIARHLYPQATQVWDVVQDQTYPPHLVDLGTDSVCLRLRVPAYGVKTIAFGSAHVPAESRGPTLLTSASDQSDKEFIENARRHGARDVLGQPTPDPGVSTLDH